jgi:hypothetical protein
MEVEQRYVIKFLVEESMKGMEIIGRLHDQYGLDAFQRTQVYCWINEVKPGKKNLSNIPPPRRAPDKGQNDCIAKALKEDSLLSTRKIVKALNIGSSVV